MWTIIAGKTTTASATCFGDSDNAPTEDQSQTNSCISVNNNFAIECIKVTSTYEDTCISITPECPQDPPPDDPYDDGSCTEPSTRPELSILAINGSPPEECKNYDPETDKYYWTNYDVVNIQIDNYDPSFIYYDLSFSDSFFDFNGAIYFEGDGTITWSTGDLHLSGFTVTMWIRVQEPKKCMSDYTYLTMHMMEQSDQPSLSVEPVVYTNSTTVTISNYEETTQYSEFTSTRDTALAGGIDAVRSGSNIEWSGLEGEDITYTLRGVATECYKYESDIGECSTQVRAEQPIKYIIGDSSGSMTFTSHGGVGDYNIWIGAGNGSSVTFYIHNSITSSAHGYGDLCPYVMNSSDPFDYTFFIYDSDDSDNVKAGCDKGVGSYDISGSGGAVIFEQDGSFH